LAAIRALLDSDPHGFIASIFVEEPTRYSEADLAERSQLDSSLVTTLVDEGLLGDPRGAQAQPRVFDSADLRVLNAVRVLMDSGMPRPVVVKLLMIFRRHLDAMDDEAFRLLIGTRDGAWSDPGQQAEFVRGLSATTRAILDSNEQLLVAIYRRTVQRLALRDLDRGRRRRASDGR
jgi:hypothetical protein